MTWRLPDTYHSAGTRRGTATLKFYEGRDILLDRVGVDVLEELEATVAVWRLEHGDVGVVAVEADGGVGPLPADRVTAEDGEPEVGEEGDRRFEVADGDADVLQSDGHA